MVIKEPVKNIAKKRSINNNFFRNLLILLALSYACITVYSGYEVASVTAPVLQKKLVDRLVGYHLVGTGLAGWGLFIFSLGRDNY